MNHSPGKLLEAFSAIRQGEFQRAFDLADSEVKTDLDSFWGWYLAAVSLGFLNRRSTFQHYLERANILNSNSPYVVYLRAYNHLFKKDMESALMEWTRLIDTKEGWLARELIEKARKGVNLFLKADNGDISYFIVLPETITDFIEGVSRREYESITTSHEDQSNQKIRSSSNLNYDQYRKRSLLFPRMIYYFLALGILAGFIFFLKDPALKYLDSRDESKNLIWKDFKIDEWAALVNPQKKETIKYIYKSKDKLIEDFEQAKQKLSDSKFNQARFLLQRILYSNADFKTKEKSKIFLSFIPEPDYQDFSDPVFPDKLLETPEFYADCLVLWQGSVLKIRDVDRGKEVSLLIKDANSDYLVDAFLQGKEAKSGWLPFADFQKKKEITEKKPQAIVYGKFKGVIGKQKVIYLELVQLWM